MTGRGLVALVLVLVLSSVSGSAQSSAPAAGLAAEAAGEWTKAIEVYKGALDRNPRDAALWVRLSQIYAALNRPADALAAVERALALAPDSADLLRARATLATWAGAYDAARDSYRRLAKLQPDLDDVSLNLARVSAWDGRTDAAVEAYRRYLRAEPGAAAAWIELARTEMWRGNYAAALEALEQYRRRFGKDDRHARQLAAVLARAGRPGEALDVLEPMLRQHPDDYDLNLTRTIALTMQRRGGEASHALETVRRLQPDAQETQSAERLVRTTLASTADPGANFYSDSSTLEVQRVAPRATVSFGTGTTISAGSEHEWLRASSGSGLEQIDGTETARHDQIWIGAVQHVGGVSVRARVGQSEAARATIAYVIGADLTPSDGVKLSVERSSGLYVVSPRTVGLGLSQASNRASLEWSPDVRTTLLVDGSHQTLSDGNERWEFTISPRLAVARTERLNLDLGAVVTQLRTAENFDHGYYDPGRYEYYAFTAYPYFKVRDSIGLGLSLAAGTQRDDFSPGLRFGGHATADATFGIFNPWALKVTGGATFNQRLGSGAFRGYGAGIAVVRRF